MSEQETKAVAARLRELYKKHGTITPDIVVQDAKQEESPLHSHFQWDTDTAALEHWREQARELIRSVRFDIVVEGIVIARPQTYVRDPGADSKQQAYTAVNKLKQNRELALVALDYEMERAEGALERARTLGVALGLEKDFNRLMAQFGKVKQKAAA